MIRQLLVLSSLLLCTAGIASAQDFNFTYTGIIGPGSNTGSGTFMTTAEGGGEFLITGITGVFDGSAITSLVSFDGNDNLLYYPTTTADPDDLDYDGVAFETASGDFNLYSEGATTNLASTAGDSDILGTFTLTPSVAPSPTPEPSSLLLLGTGLLGAVGVLRRKVLV